MTKMAYTIIYNIHNAGPSFGSGSLSLVELYLQVIVANGAINLVNF